MSMTILRDPQREELEQSLALLNDVIDTRAKEAADRIRAALREAEQEDFLTTEEAARALQAIRKIVREAYAAPKSVFRHFPDRL